MTVCEEGCRFGFSIRKNRKKVFLAFGGFDETKVQICRTFESQASFAQFVVENPSGLIQTFGTRFPRPLIQIFES